MIKLFQKAFQLEPFQFDNFFTALANVLAFSGYVLLVENNDIKSRTGLYIRNGINYSRRSEFEGINRGLIVLDVKLKSSYMIIGVYRIFNPPGVTTQREYFSAQLNLIKQAIQQAGNLLTIYQGVHITYFNIAVDHELQRQMTRKSFTIIEIELMQLTFQ